jgi:GrpB-like predicted nucleotidyltransferase (UPF0157 family)/RimJ/RimL family protein N-acetyltransferase
MNPSLAARIAELEANGLGMVSDGRMHLSPHDTRWASQFQKEAQRVSLALANPSVRLFHIGSTSIPGIHAKPILDILLATPTLALLDGHSLDFESMGYEIKGEFGLEGRRYYRLSSAEANKAYVHIHAWEEDRAEILIHLIFRDYLKTHPGEAERYEAVKLSAITGEGSEREKYMDTKAPVIDEILRKARVWAVSSSARIYATDWEIVDNSTEPEPKIEFRAFDAVDIPLLRDWFGQPHVAGFWQEPKDETVFRDKFLRKLNERGVYSYIVYVNDTPVGYIQEYEAHLVGGGWWPEAKPGTFGIDQLIGEPSFVNKGLGTLFIRRFIEGLFSDPKVKEIIADPEPNNDRAIRVYEKVGFKRVGEIQTPGGQALLLRMTRAEFITNKRTYETVAKKE